MKTIVMLGPKGGCGKTTTATNLAPAAAKDGLRVVTLDTDTQGTLAAWNADRKKRGHEPSIPGFHIDVTKAIEAIDELEAKGVVDVVIVDTAPGVEANTPAVAALIKRADLIVMPTQPTKADLAPTAKMMKTVSALGKSGMFLVTRTKPRNVDVDRARSMLATVGDVSGTMIPDTVHIPRAAAAGLGVVELNGGGAEDFQNLWKEVWRKVGI